jgi:hypothetical protein
VKGGTGGRERFPAAWRAAQALRDGRPRLSVEALEVEEAAELGQTPVADAEQVAGAHFDRVAPSRRASPGCATSPQPQPGPSGPGLVVRATDVVGERGDAATEAVLELTDGVGVDAALECVGTAQSFTTAVR